MKDCYFVFFQSTSGNDLLCRIIELLDSYDIWYSLRAGKISNGEVKFCIAFKVEVTSVPIMYNAIYEIEVGIMDEGGFGAGALTMYESFNEDEIINEIMPELLAHASVH